MTHYHLVNKQRKFVACISPKAACNTLKFWFNQSLVPPELELRRAIKPNMIPPNKIMSLEGYRRILFIRDPFCRIVSFYCKFIVKRQTDRWIHGDNDKSVDLSHSTFAEMVDTLLELHHDGIKLQHHLEPQTLKVADIPFDIVMATEVLDRELPNLNRQFGFECPTPRFNVTYRREDIDVPVMDWTPEMFPEIGMPNAKNFFNDEISEKVRKIYREDISFYNQYIGECIF